MIHEQVKDTEMSYIKIYLYKSENKTILFSNNFGFNDDFRVSLLDIPFAMVSGNVLKIRCQVPVVYKRRVYFTSSLKNSFY